MRSEVYEAAVKLGRQQQRLVDLLRRAGPEGLHMRECNAVGYLYGARFTELRKKGFVIRCVRLGRGEFKYVLDGEPYVPDVVNQLHDTTREQSQPQLFETQRVGDSVFYKTKEKHGT